MLPLVGWAYVRIRNVDSVLTTTNLYRKTDVFLETVTRVGIDRIQSTRLTKDVTGNLFDYGSIDVSTAGSSGTELRITDLDDPGTDSTPTTWSEGPSGRTRQRTLPVSDVLSESVSIWIPRDWVYRTSP